MNAKQMIDSIESMAQQHYKDGNATDRLAWQVGALQAKISEISYHYNLLVDELKITQIELSKEQS